MWARLALSQRAATIHAARRTELDVGTWRRTSGNGAPDSRQSGSSAWSSAPLGVNYTERMCAPSFMVCKPGHAAGVISP